MLKIVAIKNHDVLEIDLKGEILDNGFDLNEYLAEYAPGMTLRFHCLKIERINSIGVRAWITSFKTLQQKGIPYILSECSVAIVDQMNQMYSFVPGGRVESIRAPFLCTECKTGFTVSFTKIELKRIMISGESIQKVECPHCHSQNTEFDDLPDYFTFLKHVPIVD